MSGITCDCGHEIEAAAPGRTAATCPACGMTVRVTPERFEDIPVATGLPPVAAGKPPPLAPERPRLRAPELREGPARPMGWMLATGLASAAALAAVLFALLKPAPAPRQEADANPELEALRGNLQALEKQIAALKNTDRPASPVLEGRIRELEAERVKLHEQNEQNGDLIQDLRRRLNEFQKLSTEKPPPPGANPEPAAEGDPAIRAIRPHLVEVTTAGLRSYGLVIGPRFALTRLAAVKNGNRFTVEYIHESGGRVRKTSCAATLHSVDQVNGLALLALQPMTPLIPVTLDPAVKIKEGDPVFVPVQRQGASGPEFEKRVGKIRQESVLIGGVDCVEAAIPMGLALTGVPLVHTDGRVLGYVITAPGTAADTLGAVPVGRILNFFEKREDAIYRVKQSLDEHELITAQEWTYDRETAIKVETGFAQMVLHRESGQLLCLDPRNNGIVIVSPASRAVSKSLFTGTDPTWIVTTSGQRAFWVSNSASKNFVRIDPGLSTPVDAGITVSFPPRRFLVAEGAILAESERSGNLYVITLSDRKETQIDLRLGSNIVYNPKSGLVVGITGTHNTASVDLDKVLRLVRELGRVKAEDNSGRAKLMNEFHKGLAHHQPTIVATGWAPGNRQHNAFFDDSGRRLYLNRIVLEANRLDAVIVGLKFAKSDRYSESAQRTLGAKIPAISNILAASPDGKWFATGLHLYDAVNFTVKSELPVPSPFAVFSSDSKTLYLYDSWNGYIVPVTIE